MKCRTLTALLLCLAATACSDVSLPVAAPQLVIEGWIENGGHPVVMVTTTVSVDESFSDINELEEHVVNWAKVTVSDGENDIVLTGQRNDDYFPPYIYTTSRMRGVAGGTYTVTVEYSGRTASAVTTIPAPVPLEYIRIMQSSDDADSYYLVGGLRDNPDTKDYYKVFTKRLGKDSTYVSSFMGLTDDSVLNAEIEEIPINNGVGRVDEKLNAFFSADDVVHVRFCTLDRASWEYWNDFEEIQSLSRNPFFPITTAIRSNVTGGLGYWAGYGTTTCCVSIPDSLVHNLTVMP